LLFLPPLSTFLPPDALSTTLCWASGACFVGRFFVAHYMGKALCSNVRSEILLFSSNLGLILCFLAATDLAFGPSDTGLLGRKAMFVHEARRRTMIEKTIWNWSFICLLLTMAVFVFMVIHPLNSPTNATSPIDSLLTLFRN